MPRFNGTPIEQQQAKPRFAGTPVESGQDGSFSWDNASRAVARGALGIGSYLDELDAATNATLAPVVDPLLPDSFQKLPGGTWGERYDQALDIQRGKDKAFDQEHPYSSLGLKIAGGVGSGVGLVKAAPTLGGLALGNGGATIPGKLAAAGAAGVGTGLVQGFGAGEDGPLNRVKQALMEGATGGVTGMAMVPIAAGAKAGAKAIGRAFMGESDDALSTLTGKSRDFVVNELADPDKVALVRQRLDELGPEAMLADASPDWQGVARGAATRPGTRSAIVDPLTERSAAANSRLRADIETNMGPDPIPSRLDAEIAQSQDVVGRQYGPVMRERGAYDFTPITDALDDEISRLRGPAQRELANVRRMLNTHGQDLVTTDPSVAFQTRQAIDGILRTETNQKVIGALSEARQMIDDGLRASVPRIKEVDANFSELARQREGLGMGRPILTNEASAMRPVELDQTLREAALPQGMQVGPSAVPTRMRQGTLGEIYRAVGTEANDTNALRKIVRGEGDWNREKLGLLFGRDNADNVLNSIDRESVFGDTANRVTRGSDTAMGSRFGKFLDDMSTTREIPADTTMTGLGLRAARGVARSLMSSGAQTNASQVADDVGRLSVARGPERDAIVEALMRRGRENVVDSQRAALISAILQSGGRAAYPSLGVR